MTGKLDEYKEKRNFEYTQTEDGISEFTTSIRTGRTMKEIEEGEEEKLKTNPFHIVNVQLAKLENKAPTGEDWLYELKYDGYRIAAFLEGNSVRLMTRKEILETLMKDPPSQLYYSRYVKGNAQESLDAACQAGMEGIIGKKAHSIYSGSRNGDWIKLKCDKRQEFVIGGYTLSDKRITGVSSLLLGVYEGNDLIYVGRAGSGISQDDMKILEEKFENLKRSHPPFKSVPKGRPKEKITWLEPELSAEIKFAQWTKDNLLRHASYKGLRTDKNPKEIKKEEEEEPIEIKTKDLIIQGIKITNPDKVIFDDVQITKEDVVRYYEKVAPRMLPYVGKRVLSIVRCPKGISGSCFYRKRPGHNKKGIITIPITTSGGKGYHLVVPLKPSANWDSFNNFAKGVALVMEQKWPGRYTSNVRKAKRKGRIFIDWIRNGRGATSIAPYSLRARKGAKVSMPISWDELNTIPPDGIDMAEALLRIKERDPWEDFFQNKQMLKQ